MNNKLIINFLLKVLVILIVRYVGKHMKIVPRLYVNDVVMVFMSLAYKRIIKYEIGKEAWYCSNCLEINAKQPIKDITMDFECLNFIKGILDISHLDPLK